MQLLHFSGSGSFAYAVHTASDHYRCLRDAAGRHSGGYAPTWNFGLPDIVQLQTNGRSSGTFNSFNFTPIEYAVRLATSMIRTIFESGMLEQTQPHDSWASHGRRLHNQGARPGHRHRLAVYQLTNANFPALSGGLGGLSAENPGF